jgi:hypothetical protein
MDKMLIDRVFDYVVVRRFPNDESFWNGQEADKIIPKRCAQVRTRSALLIAAGRGNVDLTAPGTRLLAFCSKKPIAPTWAFWSLRTASFEDACLLAMWWNSTFMLNQLLEVRTEVRGSRVWFSKEAIEALPVLNPKLLKARVRSRLLAVFNEVAKVSFPSILEQLSTSFPPRVLIDESLAEVLGFREYATPERLKELYTSTAKKLEQLRSMMTRD